MHKVVLLRHGESVWNLENKFTGWADVGLSDRGVIESRQAGQILRQNGYTFDVAFTSVLRRAIRTLWIVLEEMNLMWIPVKKSWRLNEHHYGALQGLNKTETSEKYGEEQVLLWRRSYNVRPPAVDKNDEYYPGNDPRYKCLSDDELPVAECLRSTFERFLPYWQDTVTPKIRQGKNVLIVAHGTSLRALIKHLDNVSDDDIINVNVPTGVPLVYELDEELRPLDHYYLGDPEKIKRAIESVANQGKVRK